MVRDQVGPALAAGVDPVSPQADPVVAAVTAEYARLPPPRRPDLRRRLLTRVEAANDPRREAYLQRFAVINGWIAPESLAPVFTWFTKAADPGPPRPPEGDQGDGETTGGRSC